MVGHDPYPEVDDGGGVGGYGSGQTQGARWRTLSVPLVTDVVREAVTSALRRGVTLSKWPTLTGRGVPTQAGFAIQVARGKRRFAAEVALSEFEGNTRIQVSVPAEAKPQDAEVDEIAAWVTELFARARWGLP